ncbi:hypothetical protein [Coleofasciculus sp. G1-WW12-02]|uniref:hypothetical protein n=1 Tax=Coleofasciculus sp. G1-WW12-02 TaxID=3068483 RepID=UPI0040636F6D
MNHLPFYIEPDISVRFSHKPQQVRGNHRWYGRNPLTCEPYCIATLNSAIAIATNVKCIEFYKYGKPRSPDSRRLTPVSCKLNVSSSPWQQP